MSLDNSCPLDTVRATSYAPINARGTPTAYGLFRVTSIDASNFNACLSVVEHLDQFTDFSPDALVFTGRTGIPLTRSVLQTTWDGARRTNGRPDLHLHDLRHTGLTLADATGATTAELMHRAGHPSAFPALRYQHATKDRDRVLADALAALVVPAGVAALLRGLLERLGSVVMHRTSMTTVLPRRSGSSAQADTVGQSNQLMFRVAFA